jgi:GrpB-like predicted nucleotidyltransferase (UPF0157 family)
MRSCRSTEGGGSGSPRIAAVILVVDYDAAWPLRFERLEAELAEALITRGVCFVSIEHVGSTSVPGLAAKPVIDCDIVVQAKDVPRASEALISVGFTRLGELGIPQRWAFKEPPRLANSNVYVIVEGSLSLRNHLAVRDVLRIDGGLRAEYAKVKKRIASTAADISTSTGRARTTSFRRSSLRQD